MQLHTLHTGKPSGSKIALEEVEQIQEAEWEERWERGKGTVSGTAPTPRSVSPERVYIRHRGGDRAVLWSQQDGQSKRLWWCAFPQARKGSGADAGAHGDQGGALSLSAPF